MLKRLLIIITILVIATAVLTYIYRYQILQYSADTIIRRILPDYARVDKINFDAQGGRLVLENFRILNPPDFSYQYMLEIAAVTCSYKMKGKSVLDGLEILEPVFEHPTLSIERLGDGRLNLTEMPKFLEAISAKNAGVSKERGLTPQPRFAKGSAKDKIYSSIVGDKKISDIVKLPQDFTFKSGKVIFMDRLNSSSPNLITFEAIEAKVSVKLDPSYTKVLWLDSTGTGNLNGNKDETVGWVIAQNPTTPKLTMSNRFEVTTVDIKTFEPYYDKYSPIAFAKGRFSGTLVFDFDNGDIGSTNEVRLSDFQFYIKKGFENADFWETNVPALAKYLTSPSNEIVFDFKIKGDIAKPKFFLGPISKQAMASMAIDRVTSVIGQLTGSQSQGSGSPGEPKSDLDKAKEYLDMFKEFMDKK